MPNKARVLGLSNATQPSGVSPTLVGSDSAVVNLFGDSKEYTRQVYALHFTIPKATIARVFCVTSTTPAREQYTTGKIAFEEPRNSALLAPFRKANTLPYFTIDVGFAIHGAGDISFSGGERSTSDVWATSQNAVKVTLADPIIRAEWTYTGRSTRQTFFTFILGAVIGYTVTVIFDEGTKGLVKRKKQNRPEETSTSEGGAPG